MTVAAYARRILRRWRVLLSVLVLVVGVAGFVSWQMSPTYESNAQIFVTIADNENDMGIALAQSVYAQQKVLSYAAVANSERMATTVTDELGLATDPVDLTDQITSEVPFGTVIINLTVQDRNARDAQEILNSIIRNYNPLLAEIEERVGQDEAKVRISLLKAPTLAERPVSPNLLLNLLAGTFAGLLLGLAAAALRDLLDSSIKEPEDLEDLGVSLLGSTPRLKRKARSSLISVTDRGEFSENLRQVRVNLQFASVDDPPRAILVTSCVPEEGKTTVASNLASAFVQAGQSVLLVDADLRRPAVADRFDIDRSVGLSNLLVGNVTLRSAIQNRDGVHVLPSGPVPPNPSELLASQAMASLGLELAQRYDMVIYDSPPTLPFADARALAQQTDGVIMVFRYGTASKREAATAIEGFQGVGSKVLGAILNARPKKGGTSYGYAYRDYVVKSES